MDLDHGIQDPDQKEEFVPEVKLFEQKEEDRGDDDDPNHSKLHENKGIQVSLNISKRAMNYGMMSITVWDTVITIICLKRLTTHITVLTLPPQDLLF